MIDISEKLKELRIEKNMTQNDVSLSLHIARNTLSQFETGKARPSYEVLVAAADLFGVSIDYLLGREDDFGIPSYEVSISEKNLPEKKKAPIAERTQLSEIQENFISEFKEFFSEKTFWKYAQLYQAMDRDTRIFALGYLCSYLKNVGMNVDAFLK